MSFRRGLAAAVLAVALGPLVAGCGAGFSAGTTQIRPDNPAANLGPLKVRNAVVVASPGQPAAVVSLTVVNDGDSEETLAAASVGGTEAKLNPAQVKIPPHGAVNVGQPGQASIVVTGSGPTAAPTPGVFVQLTLSFANAGQLQMDVPVEAAVHQWATLTATPEPTPSGGTKAPGTSAAPTTPPATPTP